MHCYDWLKTHSISENCFLKVLLGLSVFCVIAVFSSVQPPATVQQILTGSGKALSLHDAIGARAIDEISE